MIKDGIEHCDFCDRPRTKVSMIIAANEQETGTAHICSGCVIVCHEMMSEIGDFIWKLDPERSSRFEKGRETYANEQTRSSERKPDGHR